MCRTADLPLGFIAGTLFQYFSQAVSGLKITFSLNIRNGLLIRLPQDLQSLLLKANFPKIKTLIQQYSLLHRAANGLLCLLTGRREPQA